MGLLLVIELVENQHIETENGRVMNYLSWQPFSHMMNLDHISLSLRREVILTKRKNQCPSSSITRHRQRALNSDNRASPDSGTKKSEMV